MFQKIKDASKALRAIGELEEINKEIDSMNGKSLLASKTFWFNVGTFIVTISGLMPMKYAPLVMGAGNVLLRIATNQPINLF